MRFEPPPRFVPAGPIHDCKLVVSPFAAAHGSGTLAQRAGRRYEQQVLALLSARFPDWLVPGPWFKFTRVFGSQGVCSPDALLVDLAGGRIWVVEIKAHHCQAAWWQLCELYLPIVESFFASTAWQFLVLEIAGSYCPHLPFPEPVALYHEPDDVVMQEPDVFNVLVLSPRRLGAELQAGEGELDCKELELPSLVTR